MSFTLHGIRPLGRTDFSGKIFLIMLHANTVPPHLLLAVNSRTFSLEVTGPKINGHIQPLLRLIHQNCIQSLFIELEVPRIFTWSQLLDIIVNNTIVYPTIDVRHATCLEPIKGFCREAYSTDIKGTSFVFELIPQLQKGGKVVTCSQAYLEPLICGNSFTLREYTMQDINRSIANVTLKSNSEIYAE